MAIKLNMPVELMAAAHGGTARAIRSAAEAATMAEERGRKKHSDELLDKQDERAQQRFEFDVRNAERSAMRQEVSTRLEARRQKLNEDLARGGEGRAQARFGVEQEGRRFELRTALEDYQRKTRDRSEMGVAAAEEYVALVADLPDEMRKRALFQLNVAAGLKSPEARARLLKAKAAQYGVAFDEYQRKELAHDIGDRRSRDAFGESGPDGAEPGEEEKARTEEVEALLDDLENKRITPREASQRERELRVSGASAETKLEGKRALVGSALAYADEADKRGDNTLGQLYRMVAMSAKYEHHDAKGKSLGEQLVEVVREQYKNEITAQLQQQKDAADQQRTDTTAAASAAGKTPARSERVRAVENLTRANGGQVPSKAQVDAYMETAGTQGAGAPTNSGGAGIAGGRLPTLEPGPAVLARLNGGARQDDGGDDGEEEPQGEGAAGGPPAPPAAKPRSRVPLEVSTARVAKGAIEKQDAEAKGKKKQAADEKAQASENRTRARFIYQNLAASAGVMPEFKSEEDAIDKLSRYSKGRLDDLYERARKAKAKAKGKGK